MENIKAIPLALVESTLDVDENTVVPLSLMPAGGFFGIISKEN